RRARRYGDPRLDRHDRGHHAAARQVEDVQGRARHADVPSRVPPANSDGEARRMERPSGSDGAPREKASHARLILALRVALVVVGLAPFVAPLVRRASPALGDLFYVLFTPVCHRNPARTLSIASELMPICSRCAGIFAGFVTAG